MRPGSHNFDFTRDLNGIPLKACAFTLSVSFVHACVLVPTMALPHYAQNEKKFGLRLKRKVKQGSSGWLLVSWL